MSTQGYPSANQPQQPTQKPEFNVYTMMLIISLIAILIGIILLWRELTLHGNYPWWSTAQATSPQWSVPAEVMEPTPADRNIPMRSDPLPWA